MLGKYGKKVIYGRDNGQCAYCGKPLKFNSFTVDHVVPRSKGGTSHLTNLCICCPGCNTKKGNAMPSEAIIKQIKRRQESFWVHTKSYQCPLAEIVVPEKIVHKPVSRLVYKGRPYNHFEVGA